MKLRQACRGLGNVYSLKSHDVRNLPDGEVTSLACEKLAAVFRHYADKHWEDHDEQAEAQVAQELITTLEQARDKLTENNPGRALTQEAIDDLKRRLGL